MILEQACAPVEKSDRFFLRFDGVIFKKKALNLFKLYIVNNYMI